jgi:EAL domain-containing protein (putative c-di-GMP-specific phosphodiesterase class I)
LKRFPVDTLKIDRSFVDRLGYSPQDEAIVQSVVALAQTLKLSLTAEGIETEQQLAKLRTLGCDRGQGYYFARPLPADEVRALLAPLPERIEVPASRRRRGRRTTGLRPVGGAA